jgi:hypothetical protein
VWKGRYHRQKPLQRVHRQSGPWGRSRRYLREVCRRDGDAPLDPRIEPHDGYSPEVLFGAEAHQGQLLAVEWMSRIGDLDRIGGKITDENGPTYRCILFG